MNKHLAIAGLALVVLGALWLSGSSTLLLGVRQGVPDYALPSLLVVLEIASVVGTALWVTARDTRTRVRPVVVTVLASGVAAIGGWLAYGPLGLVAPMAVVLVTDMIAERWASTAAADVQHGVYEDDPPHDEFPALHAVPTTFSYGWPEVDLEELPAPGDAERAEPDEAPDPVPPHPAAPAHDDDRTLVTVDMLDDLSRDELRAVARVHDVTVRGSADDLRARLRPVLAAVPHSARQAVTA